MSYSSMVGWLWPSRFTSTVAQRPPRPYFDAMAAASHTEPSALSASPSNTYVRRWLPSSRASSVNPMAAGSPWPSEPVATSTKGKCGVGWPSRSESICRRVSNVSREIAPAAAHAAYRIGAACPFERTNTSLFGSRGDAAS